MSSPIIRIMIDQQDGSTRELGRIETKDSKVVYTANASLLKNEKNCRIVTQALFAWVMHLDDKAYLHWITGLDDQAEDETEESA